MTRQVVTYLLRQDAEVYVESGKKGDAPWEDFPDGVREFDRELPESVFAAVVIGGDGTILRAAKRLYGTDIPMIGINLGTVGYMTELEVEECDLLGKLLNHKGALPDSVHVDERMMLSYAVWRQGKKVFSGVALNEVVLAKESTSRMIDVDLIHDAHVIASYQCDGVIVSTPTGSTAYSLSAGGAIMDPKLSCIGVVPLCPYLSIHSGSILFSDEAKVELCFHSKRDSSALLSVDGEEYFRLEDGDTVSFCAAEHKAKLLRFKDTDFYKLLNMKLKNRMLVLTDGGNEASCCDANR